MFGYSKPSLTLRITYGKIIGLLIGIAGFFFIPTFAPDASMMLRVGVLFWYATLGVLIGFAGIYTQHPVINMKLSWWWRGAIYGAFFNLLLLLFAHEQFQNIMVLYHAKYGIFLSVWWFVAEGAVIGLIMDGALTKLAGDGPQTVINEQNRI